MPADSIKAGLINQAVSVSNIKVVLVSISYLIIIF